ncbi:MAG TPA: KpsF/GutQ family sugar-phosphate isomerase [Planctomycetota bacterium]|nr:KpsF/GutQ family sugar-phosphate isomerase [Planctomycetota bacterium]
MREDIEFARQVIRLEAAAVAALEAILDERFGRAVELVLGCDGHVVTTGMGKSGLIAQKISATLASTGTPSFFLHPAEAIHGDLGRVAEKDLVIALSNSGATEEVLRLVPSVKQIGARLVAITRSVDSPLARHADCVLPLGALPEACPVGLAPTTSTTAQLALGDALAMAVAKRRKFSREDYALYHPGGELGRSLLRVKELMRDAGEVPPARVGTTAREALVQAGGLGRRPGALPVVSADGTLMGLLTDGDVRRHVLKDPGFIGRPIEEVMTRKPLAVRADQLAAEAWRMMKERTFDELPVVDGAGRYLGLLDVQDLLEAGFTSDGG